MPRNKSEKVPASVLGYLKATTECVRHIKSCQACDGHFADCGPGQVIYRHWVDHRLIVHSEFGYTVPNGFRGGWTRTLERIVEYVEDTYGTK